ncbi:MAG: hypothetical protein A3K59_11070 [Euryarchaeota archaeon RBG_19FT_COMBO_69_17]|nr:MAG: hypothetical protein A3K59_11070 [Euryarchaeota archaeon RBG_19FT_COMBO_69_17]
MARMHPWKRPAGWWLRNPRYLLFQAREVGGVLSALYGLVLLYELRQYHRGEDAFAWFQGILTTPPVLILTLVVFAFVLVHAVTWFMLIGKAQPVALTKKPIPWERAFAGNLVLWAVVSAAVLYIVFGGL